MGGWADPEQPCRSLVTSQRGLFNGQIQDLILRTSSQGFQDSSSFLSRRLIFRDIPFQDLCPRGCLASRSNLPSCGTYGSICSFPGTHHPDCIPTFGIHLWKRTAKKASESVSCHRLVSAKVFTRKLFPSWIVVQRSFFGTSTRWGSGIMSGFLTSLGCNAASERIHNGSKRTIKIPVVHRCKFRIWHSSSVSKNRQLKLILKSFSSLCKVWVDGLEKYWFDALRSSIEGVPRRYNLTC